MLFRGNAHSGSETPPTILEHCPPHADSCHYRSFMGLGLLGPYRGADRVGVSGGDAAAAHRGNAGLDHGDLGLSDHRAAVLFALRRVAFGPPAGAAVYGALSPDSPLAGRTAAAKPGRLV